MADKAAGAGHRLIGARFGVPVSTVRGWLRVIEGRAEVVRDWFVSIAVTAGVDVSIPKATGSRCGDVIAAVGAATEAVTARFGGGPVIGAVTVAQIAVAGSSARLLSPGWPPAPGGGIAQHELTLTSVVVMVHRRGGDCPATGLGGTA